VTTVPVGHGICLSPEEMDEMTAAFEAKTSSSEDGGALSMITYEDGYENNPDLTNVGRLLQDEERAEAEVGKITK
jgi:hypothetical protein